MCCSAAIGSTGCQVAKVRVWATSPPPTPILGSPSLIMAEALTPSSLFHP